MYRKYSIYFAKNEIKHLLYNTFKHSNNCSTHLGMRLVSTLPENKVIANENSAGISKKVKKHFERSNTIDVLHLFPINVTNSTKRAKEVYIANEEAAQNIFKCLQSRRNQSVPFVEINPGPGLLTKHFLEFDKSELILYEANSHFLSRLEELLHGNSDKASLRMEDFMSLPDKCSRHNTPAVINAKHHEWHEEIICQLFGCISTPLLINYLIRSVINGSDLFANGRKEFFLFLPTDVFLSIACNSSAGYDFFTSRSCIFQICFEYEFITKMPATCFLPWFKIRKQRKEMDERYLYLVRIEPRRNLLKFCSSADLKLLSQFVYQILHKRRGYVIAKLEQWFPGCGIRILSDDSREPPPVKVLYNAAEIDTMSQYLESSVELCDQQVNKNITVLTKCGELKPLEILNLFNQLKDQHNFEKIFSAPVNTVDL